MKAIALVGNIDERHRLHADVPPELPPGHVRVIVLLPEEDDAGSRWAHGVAKEWTAELEDRRQDLYTMEDGQPRREALRPGRRSPMRMRSLGVVVVMMGMLGTMKVEPTSGAAKAGATQEAAKGPVNPDIAAQKMQGTIRETVGEARFGGLWISDGRVKVGIVGETTETSATRPRLAVVDRRAHTTVMDLAAKHGAVDAVDVVPVPYTLAAIEACNQWIHTRMVDVNKGAPLPLGSGIGRVDPGLGVELRLPKNATKVQRDFAATARQRCGGMLKVTPGHVLATPLPGPPSRL